MSDITLRGNTVHTVGELPAVGSKAPDFTLTTGDMGSISLSDLAGGRVVLNISPSIDTGICATSVREFNERVASVGDTVQLYVSADLPFAAGRFCGAEGLDSVKTGSTFKNPEFGDAYGVRMLDGKLEGLLARSVVVIGADGTVLHTELVPEIAQEPDYSAAIAALG